MDSLSSLLSIGRFVAFTSTANQIVASLYAAMSLILITSDFHGSTHQRWARNTEVLIAGVAMVATTAITGSCIKLMRAKISEMLALPTAAFSESQHHLETAAPPGMMTTLWSGRPRKRSSPNSLEQIYKQALNDVPAKPEDYQKWFNDLRPDTPTDPGRPGEND